MAMDIEKETVMAISRLRASWKAEALMAARQRIRDLERSMAQMRESIHE